MKYFGRTKVKFSNTYYESLFIDKNDVEYTTNTKNFRAIYEGISIIVVMTKVKGKPDLSGHWPDSSNPIFLIEITLEELNIKIILDVLHYYAIISLSKRNTPEITK
jgi:hypothetical protein